VQNKYTLLEPLVHCKNQTEWAISRCDQVVCQCLFLCTLYDDSGPWLIIYWKTLLVHSLHLVRKIECINCSINHETIPHSLFILPKLYRIQKKHRVSHVIRKLIQTHREVSSENKRNYLKFTKNISLSWSYTHGYNFSKQQVHRIVAYYEVTHSIPTGWFRLIS
jgi:hypothetical protein